MSAPYRQAGEVPAGDFREWRWVGWWTPRCSRCGATREDVQWARQWGITEITPSAAVRHHRECSHTNDKVQP